MQGKNRNFPGRILGVFFIIAILIPVVSADGMTFLGDPDMMLLQPENDQAGAVYYEDGYENMILSVSLDWKQQGNQSVWIFPVPAKPQDVSIDVLKGFPTYDGTPLADIYGTRVGMVAVASASYATFPLTTPVVLLAVVGWMGDTSLGFAGAPPRQSGDVIIWDRVDKRGLSTEVISAKDADALAGYLASRDLALPNESLGMLDDYIAHDYSFVVTSVQNVTEYREQFPSQSFGISGPVYTKSGSDNALGVFARFPTDRIYFPLKPTRAYGNRTVPLLLTVNGYVTPDFPAVIGPKASVSYLEQDTYSPPGDLTGFFNGETVISPFTYTKILLAVPAEEYTDDLWLDNQAPAEISKLSLMTLLYPLIAICEYVIFSVTAALLAGLIVFKRGTMAPVRLLRHGLWNCATLIGFAWATRRLELPESEKTKRARFVGVFLVLFLVFVTAAAMVSEPRFVLLLTVLPLIIVMYVLFGTLGSAEAVLPVFTGHAVYLPTDRFILWGITIGVMIIVAGLCICIAYRTVQYLNK
ncbi:MAG: hypothetical protein WC342_07710 [Methanoregula sp.]|jgi:hypothetical protein